MIHLGDITKINGGNIPAVDVITGGSPCQDLSIAGKRAGLAGERSGLFMEQIRIIKEMRENDRRNGKAANDIRPRYMVWENVPGAFSSNGGGDFQAVLTEIIRIVEPDAPDVPLPEKGKWNKSGYLYDGVGGKWSIAWRLHDAQFWGVPQRRKRIALVADFGGLSAPEVLFEREGVRWYPSESKETREGVTAGAGGCSDRAIGIDGYNQSITGDKAMTLTGTAADPHHVPCIIGESDDRALSFQERAGKPGGGKGILIQNDRVGALSTVNNQNVFCIQGNAIDRAETAGCNGKGWSDEGVSYTLNTVDRPGVMVYENHRQDARYRELKDVCETITSAYGTGGNNTALVVDEKKTYQDKAGTLNPGAHPGSYNGQDAYNDMFITPIDHKKHASVRRLTPLECERLQGYPDGWTDIGPWTDTKGKIHKESSDAARYKALGNSIATPFWFWLLRRISAQYYRQATLGSLFDGIGGFPLCWELCNGKGSAIWASEIEEFPIAVTKYHFGGGI